MRTTLNLDDTALEAARQLAAHRSQSLGEVVSELILRGLRGGAPAATSRSGFPVFGSPRGKPITLEDVQAAEDDVA